MEIYWLEFWRTANEFVQEHLWPFLNSNFISGLIPAIVGLLLTRRVAEVAESNRDAEEVRSAENAALTQSQIVAKAPEADQTDNEPEESLQPVFSELSKKFGEIYEELEGAILELDGRRRRKYKNLGRHDYGPIILLLQKDQKLDQSKSEELFQLHTDWRPFSRNKPRYIPSGLVERIRSFKIA